MPIESWTEQTTFEQLAPDAIDEENGVIKRVRVLGHESKNRRRYPEAVMRAAVPLYNGVKVKLNHPDPDDENSERQVQENFGVLQNPFYQDNAIYADHLFPPKHSYSGSYVDACRRYSTALGFSHNAVGEFHLDDDGWQIVEEVTEVVSADIVDSPATNKGIFESQRERTVARKINIRKALAHTPKSNVHKALLQEIEAGAIAPDLAVDLPVDAGEVASEEDSVKAAFRSAVMALFDDDSLNAEATMAAIKKVIKTHEEVSNPAPAEDEGEAPADPTAPSAPTEEEKTTESVLRAEIRTLKNEIDCRSLLEEAGISVEKVLVESLAKLSEAERTALIKRLSASNPDYFPRPTHSAPAHEGVDPYQAQDHYGQRWDEALASD